MNREPEPSSSSERVSIARRVLRLRDPSREQLAAVGETLGIHPTLLEQVQEPTAAPGILTLPGQLAVRMTLPEWCDDGIKLRRVDLLLSKRGVGLIEPEGHGAIEESVRDYEQEREGGGDRLLAKVVSTFEGEFEDVWSTLHEELQSFEAGGRATSTVTMYQRTHSQLHPLIRELHAFQDVIRQLLDSRPFLDEVSRAQITADADRLKTVLRAAEEANERIERVAAQAAVEQADLGMESPEIVENAVMLGERRLHRITLGHAVTALIGGLAVTFGAVAMGWTAGPWLHVLDQERAHLLGSFVFPIGFVILIIGKGELFTENFFVPVTGVINKRGTVVDLLELWASTLVFNLLGSLLFAFLITRHGVLADGTKHFFAALAESKCEGTLTSLFVKGIFAGWLMTMLTWLNLAARGQGARLFIMWCIGFLIAAGHFNHVVISASEIFIGMGSGAHVTVGTWFTRNFLPALTGNLVGGVIFVTLLGTVQAHTLKQSEGRLREHVKQRRTDDEAHAAH